MRIVWEQSAYIGNAPVFCTICSHRAYPIRGRRNQLLIAVLYDRHGKVFGEVCRSCVAAGSEGMQARLSERIRGLQDKLAELQMIADEGIQTPSLEQEFQIHKREIG